MPDPLQALRIAIAQSGKTHFQVASDFGVTQGFFSQVISGHAPISAKFAFAAERVFGIPSQEMMIHQAKRNHHAYAERTGRKEGA